MHPYVRLLVDAVQVAEVKIGDLLIQLARGRAHIQQGKACFHHFVTVAVLPLQNSVIASL